MTIETRKTTRGERRYVVRWRGPDGRQEQRTFADEDDAERFDVSVRHARNEGSYVSARKGRQTFSTYAHRWLATKVDVRARSFANIEGRLRNYILPHFGDWPIARVGTEDVRAWIAELVRDSGLELDTVKGIVLTASQVFNAAELDRVIGRSPMLGVKLPRAKGRKEMLFLDEDQIEALADAIEPRYRALVIVAAYTGLRAGELEALRVERVNWLRSRLHVVESIAEAKGGLVIGPTKTYETRWVPMPRFVRDILAAHVEQYPSADGFVFTAAEGGALRHRNFMARHFRPAVARAAVPRGLRFHDLRHTCAGLLIADGADLERVKTILGHRSIRTTSDCYGHLRDDFADELMGALETRRARAVERRECVLRELVNDEGVCEVCAKRVCECVDDVPLVVPRTR